MDNRFVEIYRIDRLQEVLNMNSELLEAYNLKEEFLRITTHVKYKDAKRQLKEWVKQCYDSKIPEMVEAANTINNWINESNMLLILVIIQMDLLKQIIIQ